MDKIEDEFLFVPGSFSLGFEPIREVVSVDIETMKFKLQKFKRSTFEGPA